MDYVRKLSNINLVTMASVFGLELLAEGILSPILPLYLTYIGITPKILGLMFSLVWMGMIIGEGIWGWISDKLGPKIPLSVGTLISGLLVLGFALSVNIPLIFTIFLFWGIFRSAIFGPIRGYIGTNTPPLKKATFMAIFNSVMIASSCLGTLPSGFIVDSLGYHWNFYISSGISILAGIILIGGLKIPLIMKRQNTTIASRPGKYLYSKVWGNSYHAIIIQCIVTALAHIGFGLSMTFLPLLATQVIGVNASKVGILFGIAALITVIFAIPIGTLADRKRRKVIMILGLLVSVSGLAGISFVGTFWWLVVCFVVLEIGMATFNSAALALLSEKVLPQQQGTAMGFYGGAGENLGTIIGTVLGGVFWSFWGQKVFLLGMTAGCVGTIICLILVKDTVPVNVKRTSEL
jgi:MFS family permease